MAELKKCIQFGHSVGNEDEHAMEIPEGFRVVYSQEEQINPEGVPEICHHLSVSVDSYSMYPHEVAVKTICSLFGMTYPGIAMYLEEEYHVVNIIDPISRKHADNPVKIAL